MKRNTFLLLTLLAGISQSGCGDSSEPPAPTNPGGAIFIVPAAKTQPLPATVPATAPAPAQSQPASATTSPYSTIRDAKGKIAPEDDARAKALLAEFNALMDANNLNDAEAKLIELQTFRTQKPISDFLRLTEIPKASNRLMAARANELPSDATDEPSK